MSRIIVGLSGGVDSAVSAWLLREAGHDVEALFMFNWNEDDDAYCAAADDFAVARQVCTELGIPLHRADFSREYAQRVFAHFLAEYEAGRTPSPDLLCNREIKFGEFAGYARRLGADAIATGHYAGLETRDGRVCLMQAADPDKDQTYFLAAVRGPDFERVVFPLADLCKPQVRDMANAAGLPNHQRRDSTGICFIGERPMREFLARYMHTRPGPILDRDGQEIGRHQGLAFHTLGQRRGLGIGGRADGQEAPWYVLAKDPERNALIAGQDRQDPLLLSRRIRCAAPLWIHRAPPLPGQYQVRIRHRQALQDCLIHEDQDGIMLDFAQAQWAAAPGQYAVIYEERTCLGCAVITDPHPDHTG